MKPIIVSISGPSGAGKSFLAGKLKEKHDFKEIVSVTTRAPREGEVNGVHYFFVDKDTFLKMDEENQLIEKTEVNGNYYGVPSSEPLKLAKEGKPIVVVAEPHGIQQIKDYCAKNDWISLEVFVNSPIDVLMKRLENRKNEELERLDHKDPEYKSKIEKIVKSSESRKKHIEDVEFKEWVAPAISKDSIFKLVVDSFNERNEFQVIDKVLDEVRKLKKVNQLKNKKPKENASKKMTL